MATAKWGLRARLYPLTLALSLLLAACGGSGGSPAPAAQATTPAQARGATTQVAADEGDAVDAPDPADGAGAGLQPQPPEVVDASPGGERLLKAVGGLDDGGHVVVWMSREPGDTGTAWPLWSQRFDAQGRKAGGPVRLDYLPEVAGPNDVAVTVLPEGRIGVSFLTLRNESPVFAITEVHHWPFNLEGSIDGMVRVLDAERFPRFSPRFARLGGPLTAAAGRDGSQYLAWRYQIVGAAPLAPSVRAQRLAADGEPLGWIQRLDGQGTFSRVGRVRITPLDEGGWVLSLERFISTTVHYNDFVQLDVPRPLAMPLWYTHSASAFLLDLRGHGSVLFTSALDTATGAEDQPRRVHFTARGAAQADRPSDVIPATAVALAGGDYLRFEPQGERLAAQRFTPAGDPVGAGFLTEATPGALVTGLRRGGMVLAWVAQTPEGGVQVLSQRYRPNRPEQLGGAP